LHRRSFVKKLLTIVFVAMAFAFGMAFVATDPGVQRRVEAERRAKQQAAQEEADRKQKEWRDGWTKWMEEGKRKTDERVKQANEAGFDDGFRMGFMGAQMTRSKTNVAVSSKQIEATAIKEADRQAVPAGSQAGFVRGFKAGWGFGWTSK
jgi:Flp pilus assembly protein TadB